MVLFPDVLEVTQKFTDSQFGQLIRAVFAYRFSGSEYTGEDFAVDVAFRMLKGQIDRYFDVCEINRENAIVRNSARKKKACEAAASILSRISTLSEMETIKDEP